MRVEVKRVCITNRKPRRFELRDVLWISEEGEGERRREESESRNILFSGIWALLKPIRYLFSSEYVILLQFNFISLLCYVIRFFSFPFFSLLGVETTVEDRGNLLHLSD